MYIKHKIYWNISSCFEISSTYVKLYYILNRFFLYFVSGIIFISCLPLPKTTIHTQDKNSFEFFYFKYLIEFIGASILTIFAYIIIVLAIIRIPLKKLFTF